MVVPFTCALFRRIQNKKIQGLLRVLFVTGAIYFFMGSSMHGQTGNAAPTPRKSDPHAPVLILHGLCPTKSNSPNATSKGSSKPCETVITRYDFDSLIAALDPNMPESNRLVLANEYIKLLAMGHEAERLRLDREETFRKLEEFTRLQLLQRQLIRSLESQASSMSQEDIAHYYQEHQAAFEEGSFRKIFIPKQGKWMEPGQAETLRERAVKGEDFDLLQREVWAALGRPSGAPTTHTSTLKRATLPNAVQGIFDLKPDDVSRLIAEGDGNFIYKIESRHLIPLDLAANEIRTLLAAERMQERTGALRDSVTTSVNEDYFGPLPTGGDLMKHHGMEHQGWHLMPMNEADKS